MKKVTCQNYIDGMKKLQTLSDDFREELIKNNKDISQLYKLKKDMEEALDFLDRYQVSLRVELAKRLNLNHVEAFYDGWAKALVPNLQIVFVNELGEFLYYPNGKIVEIERGMADRFSEGRAAIFVNVTQDVEEVSYLDISGQVSRSRWIHSGQTELARFNLGLAVVSDSPFIDELKYIDKDLKAKDGFENIEVIGPFSQDGYAVAKRKNARKSPSEGNFGFINNYGQWLSMEDGRQYFKQISEFSEGYAAVKNDNGYWWFIDIDGKYQRGEDGEKIFAHIDIVGEMHDGFSRIRMKSLNSNSAFMRPNGELLTSGGDHFHGQAQDFSEGFAVVEFREMDEEGETRRFYRFMKTNGEYICDKYGKTLEFATAHSFDEGLAYVRDIGSGDMYYINHFGRKVTFQ